MTHFTFNVIKDDKFDFTPKKANEFDSGYDCCAWLPDGDIIVPINTKKNANGLDVLDISRDYNHVKIPLGFSIGVNESFIFKKIFYKANVDRFGNYYGMNEFSEDIQYKLGFNVRMRSGNAFQSGIQGHIGTIDTTYGKQVCAMLYNTSNIPFTIKHGDRICQIVPELIPQLQHDVKMFDKIEELDGGIREGFGSTGKN